jgi:hypothetical protein
MTRPATAPRDLPSWALIPFVLLTFGITWGLFAGFVTYQEQVEAATGPLSGRHPGFVLATWAPAISGLMMVLVFGGVRGLRAYLSRLLLWRVSWPWVAFVLLGVPLIFAGGSLIKGNLFTDPFPFDALAPLLSTVAFMAILGPMEEFGWRGVAQPILQRHVAPLFAGVIIGTVWGLWHLPAFLLSGLAQSSWSFGPFLLGNIALAVLVTPLFNAARGSILWAMLFHWQVNMPMWPDAQPYDTWVFAGAAVVVVWLNRKTMLRRGGAVTRVIPA